MKCPHCAAAASDDAADCPACGLVFAKGRERQEKEKAEAAAALAALESPKPARALSPWIGRSVAAVVVAWWVLGLMIYYVHSLKGRDRSQRPVSGPGN